MEFCIRIQFTAKATFLFRFRDILAKVLIGLGEVFEEVAVEWLTWASVFDRNTPPPPLQTTEYNKCE